MTFLIIKRTWEVLHSTLASGSTFLSRKKVAVIASISQKSKFIKREGMASPILHIHFILKYLI
jgi:uncharacterized protein YrrD